MRGYSENKEEIVGRLRRIEGQIRGLQRMVEQDTYCIDIITQISAASSGLRRVAVSLLDDHLTNCVAEAAGSASSRERSERVAEATAAVARLLKG